MRAKFYNIGNIFYNVFYNCSFTIFYNIGLIIGIWKLSLQLTVQTKQLHWKLSSDSARSHKSAGFTNPAFASLRLF